VRNDAVSDQTRTEEEPGDNDMSMRDGLFSHRCVWFLLSSVLGVSVGSIAWVLPGHRGLNENVQLWQVLTLVAAVLIFAGVDLLITSGLRNTMATALCFGLVLYVALSFLSSWLVGAVSRGRQLATISRIRELAHRIEAFRTSEGTFPPTLSLEDLERTDTPEGVVDGWGNEFVVEVRDGDYIIVSHGECGVAEEPNPWSCRPGVVEKATGDIVFRNGRFLRAPRGVSR
jgi:hypothetical protein